jgi:hypothetical protein
MGIHKKWNEKNDRFAALSEKQFNFKIQAQPRDVRRGRYICSPWSGAVTLW